MALKGSAPENRSDEKESLLLLFLENGPEFAVVVGRACPGGLLRGAGNAGANAGVGAAITVTGGCAGAKLVVRGFVTGFVSGLGAITGGTGSCCSKAVAKRGSTKPSIDLSLLPQ